jgi:DNA-directed RNA polymerase specialized sigma24 family protein
MSLSESVTEWLAGLKQGDTLAAQRLWERYVAKLIRLARHRLGRSPRRVADEEDVVAVAFASLCRGVEDGRFSRLDDRDDLWQVLVVLTERKAVDQRRRELAAKRGGGEVRGGSALEVGSTGEPQLTVGQAVDKEPAPDFAAEVAEQLSHLLTALNDEALRQIAVAKIEGYTNEEIGTNLEIGLRTVERRLGLIRRIWKLESA